MCHLLYTSSTIPSGAQGRQRHWYCTVHAQWHSQWGTYRGELTETSEKAYNCYSVCSVTAVDVYTSISACYGTQQLPCVLSFHLSQTFHKVCPICNKCMSQTVTIKYDECGCVERVCSDCDGKLLQLGNVFCHLHGLSKRKKLSKWPLPHLLL